MIHAIPVSENIMCIKYIGNDKRKTLKFFSIITYHKCRSNYELKGWEIRKDLIKQLEKEFEVKIIEQPYEQMGEGMLLPPFTYQKEAIYFGLNNLNSLMILPPGTGKYFSILNKKS